MNPIDFPEANRTFTKPASMTDEECGSLRVQDTGDELVSCWQPTEEERAALLAGAPVRLHIMGRGHPPVRLWVQETKLPGAGGGERTGPKEDAARANAAGGGKGPAAADGAPGAAAADGPTPTLRTAAFREALAEVLDGLDALTFRRNEDGTTTVIGSTVDDFGRLGGFVRALSELRRASRCGAWRKNGENVAFVCRRPPGHDGDHHPNPCGHDGCTGGECLRAPPPEPRDDGAIREALIGLRRGGIDPEALDCWCQPWWDDRPASGPPRFIHSDACERARAALASSPAPSARPGDERDWIPRCGRCGTAVQDGRAWTTHHLACACGSRPGDEALRERIEALARQWEADAVAFAKDPKEIP